MPDEEITAPTSEEPIEYTCVRCGFKYHKNYDFPPFLCYRCLRYMAKKVWIIVHTIQPPTSTPAREDI